MPAVNKTTYHKFTAFIFASCRMKIGLGNVELWTLGLEAKYW